jgi:hypothetical protein
MKGRTVIQMALRRIAVAMAIAATLVTSAHAQDRRLSARIPFAFHVGNSVLPAGSYTLQDVEREVLRIGNRGNQNATVMVLTTPARSEYRSSPRLVFHGYGGNYFLAQIDWGYGVAHEIPAANHEREIAEAVPARIVTLAAK